MSAGEPWCGGWGPGCLSPKPVLAGFSVASIIPTEKHTQKTFIPRVRKEKARVEMGLSQSPSASWHGSPDSNLGLTTLPLLEEPGEPDRTGSVGVWGRTAGKNQVLETCAWVHIPALPLGSCVCLGKSLQLSVPQKRAETVALGCQTAVRELEENNTGLGLRATPYEVPVFTPPTTLAQSPSDSTPTPSQH